MDRLRCHTEGGEGALGMPEGGAVKEGGLEVKEMQKIPLILSASLVRPSFTEYLDRGFKIRVSQATLQNSAILPTCGVAALIVPLPPSSSSSSKEETFDQLVDRVRAFSRVHAGGVVILVGAVFGMEEVNGVLGKLSRRLLPRPSPATACPRGSPGCRAHTTTGKEVAAGLEVGGSLAGFAKIGLEVNGGVGAARDNAIQGLQRAGVTGPCLAALVNTLERDTLTL
ncbi:uncharacterized protein LOC135089942 isoform X1 [Scylla paramamosain]|uniref:uncharacterized protein LOC135089942 isoform X1 n=1 Tax=Scylla paramamosain TaxID=85552 RepID=UPI003083E7BF